VDSFANINEFKANEDITAKSKIADIANKMRIRLRNYGVVCITPIDRTGQNLIKLNLMQNRDEESDEYADVHMFYLTLNPKGLETV